MKELLYKKGYHLEVTSWENDGDNYRTKTVYVGDSVDNALELLRMCKEIFASKHSARPGIGNMMDGEYMKAAGIVQEYLMENDDVVTALMAHYKMESFDINDVDKVHDLVVSDFHYSVMGSSEYYTSRVFESGRLIFIPEDLTVEVVANTQGDLR